MRYTLSRMAVWLAPALLGCEPPRALNCREAPIDTNTNRSEPPASMVGNGNSAVSCDGDQPPPAEDGESVVCFADFGEFVLDRRHLLAPGADTACVGEFAYGEADGNILYVRVGPTESGAMSFTYSEFEIVTYAEDCNSSYGLREIQVAERELEPAEATALRQAFRSVRIYGTASGSGGCGAAATCCTSYAWDGMSFTDSYGVGAVVNYEDELQILLTLRRMRYGLLAAPPASLGDVVGSYHLEGVVDATNLSLMADGRATWDIDGCDSFGMGSGSVNQQGGTIVITPEERGFSPFCVCPGDAAVNVERIDENTIATTSEQVFVVWHRGRACAICSSETLGIIGFEPCD